jgi:hypothetical protein
MPKLQLSFHGTFALKKEELGRMLHAATEAQGVKDSREGLMTRTGLGNEKVFRVKGWAERSGLIQNNFLSPVGKIVWHRDSGLESHITNWLMHFYLSFGDKGLQSPPADPAEWGGWSYFVYSFLPRFSTFTLEELIHHFAGIFTDKALKDLTRDLRIMLRSYVALPPKYELPPLHSCKLLTLESGQLVAHHPHLPSPYLVGYFLAKLWERDFPHQGSVLTSELVNHPWGLASALGIPQSALEEQLNLLETYGIIEQRRAVPPFQIVPRWQDPLTLLEKAYDAQS